jgi:hypothetical protein
VESLNDTFNRYTENWKNHVEQMIEKKVPRKMVDYQVQLIRSRGRPRKNGNTKPEEPHQAFEPNASGRISSRRLRKGTGL